MPKSVVRVMIPGFMTPPDPAAGPGPLGPRPLAARCAPRSRAARFVDRRDPRSHPAARVEVPDDLHPPRPARRHQVVEDGVDRVLVEDPPVAEVEEVELQALQ